MDIANLVESLFRWAHVIAGILWIGLLYFFNWVNTAFAPKLDAETKKKALPELLPRALYWFRMGAAWTWVTGIVLLALVYYKPTLRVLFDDPSKAASHAHLGILLVALAVAVFVYDILYKTVLKSPPQLGFFAGIILASAVVWATKEMLGFSYRAYMIHLGAMFGSMMAFNVWFRIWPAQQKIIAAVKAGTAPDPALAALAGGRSKHNTYMSFPLVFTMIAQHGTWAASSFMYVPVLIFVGWSICWMLYKRAPKVEGAEAY